LASSETVSITLLAAWLATLATLPGGGMGLQPAGRAPFTLDDEMKMRAIVDVRISPDGERVAYVVSTPSVAKNEHEAALFVVPSGGGTPLRLGESVHIFTPTVPRPQLRWAPDGSAVSIVGVAANAPQVFSIPIDGTAPRGLTAAPDGVFGYEWSPDGKSLAYLTRDPMSPEESRRRQDKSFVIHADAPDPVTRLVVQRLDGSAPHVITPPVQYVDSFSWSPDSRELAYSAAPRTGFTAPYETRLYIIPAEGGAPRTVLDRVGINQGPRFSPDGRRLAFITTDGKADIMASRSLAVVPARGGTARTLAMNDAWVNEYVWASDSRSIYFEANDGTFSRGKDMFDQPIARVFVDTGRAERLRSGATVDYAPSLSTDGRRLAFKAAEGRTVGDVYVMDTASRRSTKLTDVNPELHDRALGEMKPISWRSFDGMEIWGLLLTPPGWTAGRPLPLLVYVHGGPGGGFTHGLFPQFMHIVPQVDPYPTEAMAAAGFAILMPMPRGGAGYGEAGQRMIVNAWGEADYKDIMTGVDHLVATRVADPQRLGVMGASYGGFMTNWIVTQTDRFKAAASNAALSDLTDEYYLSEGGQFMVDYFKRPWENRDGYAAHSPLTFVQRVTTPLLIQHGERDARVPIADAWKFYRALKALGKTVELDIHPRGGHVLYEPALQREQMRRNLEWFTRWIKTEVQ
jgi:dipeptidyl aminopeptidase/acylaminoacyl peptidase